MESDSGPNRKRKMAVEAILNRNAEAIRALHGRPARGLAVG